MTLVLQPTITSLILRVNFTRKVTEIYFWNYAKKKSIFFKSSHQNTPLKQASKPKEKSILWKFQTVLTPCDRDGQKCFVRRPFIICDAVSMRFHPVCKEHSRFFELASAQRRMNPYLVREWGSRDWHGEIRSSSLTTNGCIFPPEVMKSISRHASARWKCWRFPEQHCEKSARSYAKSNEREADCFLFLAVERDAYDYDDRGNCRRGGK